MRNFGDLKAVDLGLRVKGAWLVASKLHSETKGS